MCGGGDFRLSCNSKAINRQKQASKFLATFHCYFFLLQPCYPAFLLNTCYSLLDNNVLQHFINNYLVGLTMCYGGARPGPVRRLILFLQLHACMARPMEPQGKNFFGKHVCVLSLFCLMLARFLGDWFFPSFTCCGSYLVCDFFFTVVYDMWFGSLCSCLTRVWFAGGTIIVLFAWWKSLYVRLVGSVVG